MISFALVPRAAAWTSFVNGTRPGFTGGNEVIVDGAGNIIVGASIADGGGSDGAVFKLNGTTEVWRHVIDGGGNANDFVSELAVDAAGDVVAIGLVITSEDLDQDGLIVKLAGDTGAERWRVTLDGGGPTFNSLNDVAIDSNGDVIVAGALSTPSGMTALTMKLAGATGAELWRLELPPSGQLDFASGVAVMPGNDVLVSGGHAGLFQTARLDAATGTPVWATPFGEGSASAVTYNPTSQTADFAGQFVLTGGFPNFALLRLDVVDGGFDWYYVQATTGPASENVASRIVPAADGSGDVVAAGSVKTLTGGSRDLFAVRVSTLGGEQWTRTIDGSAHGADYLSGLRVDSGGSPVLTGSLENADTGSDGVAVKLDPTTGAVTWTTTFDGPIHRNDSAEGVAIDGGGNPIVVGPLDKGAEGYHLFAARLSAGDGAVIEEFEAKGDGFGSRDAGKAVALAPDGDVVVGGYTVNASEVSQFRADFTVARLDGRRGGERWRYVLPGAGTTTGVHAVAVDAANNVLAAGSAPGSVDNVDPTVVKLDPNGNLIWIRRFVGDPGADDLPALAVGPDGSAVVAGTMAGTDTGDDFFVAKLDPDGVEAWRRIYRGTANSLDGAKAIAVDAAGDAVAVGYVNGDGFVAKLAGTDGAERWSKAVVGEPAVFDSVDDAVIDPATGDVLAVATVGGAGTYDIAVVRLAAGDGNELWRATYDGPSQESDLAIAIALAPDGDVVATARFNVTVDALFVVKLGPDKAPRWSYTLAGSNTLPGGVAVDAAGNVAVVATSDGNVVNTARDLIVLNLDAASGTERWRHRANGAVIGSDDAGAAIAFDALGGVVAAGTVENPPTLEDMTVIRLSPDGDDVACLDVAMIDPECRPCDAGCDDAEPCTSDACGGDAFCAWTPVDGEAATTCGLDRSLDVPQCADQRVPRAIKKKFKRAGKLARRGLASSSPSKQQRLVARGSNLLARTLVLVDKAEHKRRRPLSAECAAALRALIQDTKQRLDARLAG